jgi:hypothetical protein
MPKRVETGRKLKKEIPQTAYSALGFRLDPTSRLHRAHLPGNTTTLAATPEGPKNTSWELYRA